MISDISPVPPKAAERLGYPTQTNVLYQGKVASAAAPQVWRATIHDEYEAVITEEATAQGATGETKFSYTLEQLVHVVDDRVATNMWPS